MSRDEDRTKHLLLAVLFTGLALLGAYLVLPGVGDVTRGFQPSQTGTNISVNSGLVPLIGCVFAAGYCWWAYFKDPR